MGRWEDEWMVGGRMDRWMDGRMDEWVMGGWWMMGGWMDYDGWEDGWVDDVRMYG